MVATGHMPAGTNINAEAGPSRIRKRSLTDESASPIAALEDVPDEEKPVAGGGGVVRNGLKVDENGEVTKVPAFLTKLFSMVSDKETDELIHWSKNGDSFLIPSQEQLAKKILPKFFKHSNFQSFVRQLNMYAFHKVPHNSATPTGEPELWEFINPLFKRSHPELLGRISRRQRVGPVPSTTAAQSRNVGGATQLVSPGGTSRPIHLITDGTIEGDSGASGSNMLVGPTGMLDLTAITTGLANIQRTQASIGADLKALQASNEHLWREAMEQRDKHTKHQETIDLIVSFLERLFGTDGEGLKGLKEAMRRSGLAGRAGRDEGADEGGRKKRRLGLDRMIGDGTEQAQLVEIPSDSSRFSSFTSPTRLTRNRSRGDNLAPTSGDWSQPGQSSGGGASRFTTLPSEGEPSPLPSQPGTAVSSEVPSRAPSARPQPGQATGGHVPSNGSGTSAANQARGRAGADMAHVSPMSDSDAQPNSFNALAPYNYPSNPQFNPSANQLSQGQSGNVFDTISPGNVFSNTASGGSAGMNGNGIAGGGVPAVPMSPNTAHQAAAAFNLDPSILQTTIGSLLQSPAAAQMFLNSLNASAQGQVLASPARGHGMGTGMGMGNGMGNGEGNGMGMGIGMGAGTGMGQGMGMGMGMGMGTNHGQGDYFGAGTGNQYPSSNQPNFALSGNYAQQPGRSQNFNSTNMATSSDPTLALFSPLPHQDALLANQDALMKSYQDAVGMEGDLGQLQDDFDALVRSMGLDIPEKSTAAGQAPSSVSNDAGQNLGSGNVGGQTGSGTGSGSGSGSGSGFAREPGSGGLVVEDPVVDLPDGFDMDEFLRNLNQPDEEDDQGEADGLGTTDKA